MDVLIHVIQHVLVDAEVDAIMYVEDVLGVQIIVQ